MTITEGSEMDPLSYKSRRLDESVLRPISARRASFASLSVAFFETVALAAVALLFLPLAFVLVFLTVATSLGPLAEYLLSKRDERVLCRARILEEHPEMFLLDIPSDVNDANLGRPYRIMVRLTRPKSPPDPPLPPVIFPAGLASNLMTMSIHQDELTAKHGFLVVNFDRLGVGLSDPFPRGTVRPPSAADVAREMEYVMRTCGAMHGLNGTSETDRTKWIQVGGSMGTNVATALVSLHPGRLCGFLNLDGLPHAFLRVQCKKFLKDGPRLMSFMRAIRWTGLPRLAITLALRPVIPAMGKAFTPTQIVGLMCREEFFTATGLEYTTLMSCCDLECAAWGPQATIHYDTEAMFLMASLEPFKSIVVNEMKSIPREECNERSSSELGKSYVKRTDREFVDFEARFRAMVLRGADSVDRVSTHCDWPNPPQHPVGTLVGGVRPDEIIYPLAQQFRGMVVRVMCARDYKGLERDYNQVARNHAAARTSLQVIMSDDGLAYYYPRLSHINLWQQSDEVVRLAYEMARAVGNVNGQQNESKV